MSLSISVDTSGLEKKILEKSIAMKKSMGQALKEEGGLLALSLIKYTQPFGTGAEAKGQGESALLRDLTEAFYILPDALLAGATTDRGNMRLFVSKLRIVWMTPMENWQVSASLEALQEHHDQLRTKDGRVRRNRNKVDIQGALAVINLWVISASQFDALLKFLVPRVGYAKGGWAAVCRKLGRSNSEVPAWIKNHTSPGSVIDNTDQPNPSLTMINEVNYTGRALAIKEREVKIQLAIDRAIKYGVKDK
jgi:hypothetical protein